MRTLIATILFLVSLNVATPDYANATPPNPGDPAPCGSCNNNVTWPKLPLACLPSRAERWKDASEMQPCHCPPPERCPTVDALTPADLKFYVGFSVVCGPVSSISCSVTGDEIPGFQELLTSGNVFNNSPELLQALKPLVAQRCGGHDITNRREQCGSAMGAWVGMDITAAVNSNDNLLDWVNNTLDLPVELAVHCCDSICPAGLTPSFKDVEVEITEIVGEGTGTPASCDKATSDLTAAQTKLTDDQKTADDAAKNAKDKCEEPNGAPGAACNAAQQAAHDAATTVTEDLNEVDRLSGIKTAACDIPQTITKTITVQTVSCGKTTHYPREGCVKQGTPITLMDGSTKKVDELKVGDEIKGNEGAAKIVATTKFTQEEDYFYSINGGEAFFTVEHPILTKAGWKSVDPKITSTKGSQTKILGKLTVGDKILTTNGEVEVKSIEKKTVTGGVSAYNLKVEGDGSFIANGVILKGFNQMQMHY